MKLKVIEKRIFKPSETPFAQTYWEQYINGLYEVVWYPNSKPDDVNAKAERILMFWGYDENMPNDKRILLCMPFPGFSIVAEQERPPLAELKSSPVETGISGDVLLKAIAIAQDPKLALELL